MLCQVAEAGIFWAASTAAPRTSVEPCLVIRRRWTWVPDSRCFGVSPAQEHRCRALGNRRTSPISATNTAARIGPTPGMAWIAAQPGSHASREASSRLAMPISRSSASIRRHGLLARVR